MKKYLIAIGIAILLFFMLSSSNSEGPEKINRTPVSIYPITEYKCLKKTTIYYKHDKYYHNTWNCDFAITEDRMDMLTVSTYEAVERGFKPCPNCVFETVIIRKD